MAADTMQPTGGHSSIKAREPEQVREGLVITAAHMAGGHPMVFYHLDNLPHRQRVDGLLWKKIKDGKEGLQPSDLEAFKRWAEYAKGAAAEVLPPMQTPMETMEASKKAIEAIHHVELREDLPQDHRPALEALEGYPSRPQFIIDEEGRIDLFDPAGQLDSCKRAKELGLASPSHGDLAELINQHLRLEMVEAAPGAKPELMWWDGRLYRSEADKVIASCVQTIMGRKAKRELILETVAYLERMKHLCPRPVERGYKVAVQNGILDLETGELGPFRPDIVLTTSLPVTYDPQAEPYQICKFLDDVLDDEAGKDADGTKLDFCALMEYIGAILEPGQRWQKGAILVGQGANGKTVLLQVLTALLGAENVAAVSMEELGGGSRYAAADLVGKMANICADVSGKALTDTATLKKALGGDAIHAERKYGQPFSFTNQAKMLFSCNSIPESPDLSIGWTRRWMIFNFPRSFTGAEADPNLVSKLTTPNELSGLLNLALEGRKRLISQGYFTGHDDMERDRERYLMASDPATHYLARHTYSQVSEIEEDGIKTPIPYIEVSELYLDFVDWCKENHIAPRSQIIFSGKVQTVYQGSGISKVKKWIGDRKRDGRCVHVWYGLGLNRG